MLLHHSHGLKRSICKKSKHVTTTLISLYCCLYIKCHKIGTILLLLRELHHGTRPLNWLKRMVCCHDFILISREIISPFFTHITLINTPSKPKENVCLYQYFSNINLPCLSNMSFDLPPTNSLNCLIMFAGCPSIINLWLLRSCLVHAFK